MVSGILKSASDVWAKVRAGPIADLCSHGAWRTTQADASLFQFERPLKTFL